MSLWTRKETVMANAETRSPVKKALFVRLRAKPGKEAGVEAFLRDPDAPLPSGALEVLTAMEADQRSAR